MQKKERIRAEALKLFSNEGFNAVSTARIANDAEVSEGLIFKHFKNKRGLLDSIYGELEQKIESLMLPVLLEDDPQIAIEKYIDTVFEIESSDYSFWKLIFKLKWDNDFYKPNGLKPLIEKLSWSFKKLKYQNPKMEANMLVHTMENLFVSILRDGLASNKRMQSFLKKKYKS